MWIGYTYFILLLEERNGDFYCIVISEKKVWKNVC